MTSYLAVFHPPANPDCRTLWTRLNVTRETSFVLVTLSRQLPRRPQEVSLGDR